MSPDLSCPELLSPELWQVTKTHLGIQSDPKEQRQAVSRGLQRKFLEAQGSEAMRQGQGMCGKAKDRCGQEHMPLEDFRSLADSAFPKGQ